MNTKNMRLEPDVPKQEYITSVLSPQDVAMLSLAVSMKRIADALEAFLELAQKETQA